MFHALKNSRVFAPRATAMLGLLVGLLAPQAAEPSNPPSAAPETLPPGASVVELVVAPSSVELHRRIDYAQLIVTAKLNTGDTADVTRLAQKQATGCEVSPSGLVRAKSDGAGEIVITLGEKSVKVPVTATGTGAPLQLDYLRDVNPVVSKLGCNAGTCHGSKEGKAGFKLSLRGYDPVFDIRAFTDDVKGRRINVASPDDSLLLLKATGAVPHEGQQVTPHGSDYYQILRAWIADGAKVDLKSPKAAAIEVFPTNPVLQHIGAKQQFRIVATYPDGVKRDVTAEAFIESGNQEVLTADKSGLTTSLRRGEAAILARYEGCYASTVVTVMGDRTGFVWQEPPANNEIDHFVIAKLKRMKTLQSPICNDLEFIRRVTLDLTGLPPTPEAIRAFLADPRDSRWKRDELIDKLVGSDEYVEHYANKWADLLQVNGKFLGGEGAALFRAWIREEVKQNTPYDQFVRKILTATGSNKENPAASYYKILREPTEIMENTMHLFLATRFNCNKCHDHPFERWTQDQYYEVTAYFAQTGLERDPASGDRTIGGTAVEGAKPLYEVVVDRTEGETKHERTGAVTAPAFPYPATPATSLPDKSRREKLAAWLTAADNQFFAKSFVNRLWGYLTGTGLIEPLDDIRAGNPPTNPELLDWLTQQFIDSNFNSQHIIKLICKSRTYQLSIAKNQWNADDTINYSHAKARRLPAETLYDAIYAVTGATRNIPGVPPGTRAAALSDAQQNPADGFLTNLGRPARESACECERSNELQLGPIMALVSGPTVGDAISAPNNALQKLAADIKDDRALFDEIFLRVLGRPAKEGEIQAALDSMAVLDQQHDELTKALAAREAELRPQIEAKEKEREERIAAAKMALEQYTAELGPRMAERERQRQAQIDAAQKAVQEHDAALAAKIPELEAQAKGQVGWQTLAVREISSTNKKTKFQKEPDGSIFVAEGQGKQDYVIIAETELPNITGLRLEALADSRIPGGGPGRSGAGNFVLGELLATWQPAVGPDWKLTTEANFDAGLDDWKGDPATNEITPQSGVALVRIKPNTRKSFISGPAAGAPGDYVAEFRIKAKTKLKLKLYWTTQKDFAPAEVRSAAASASRGTGEFATFQFPFTCDSELTGLKLQIDTPNIECEIDAIRLYAGKPVAPQPVKFTDAIATYEQTGYGVKSAIDGTLNATTNGWAIYPDGIGKTQTAVFTAEPINFGPGGGMLTLKMHQPYQDGKHTIGKFRLSLTNAPGPLNYGLPQEVLDVLAIAAAQRDEAQRAVLIKHLRTTDPEAQKRDAALAEASKPLPEDPKLVELRNALTAAEQPVPIDPLLARLRKDTALSEQQRGQKRLTAAQDLAWALINSPAFLFNH